MHVRGQIRDAFAALVAGVSGLDADHVFADTDEMLQAAEFPAACVWVGDEQIEHETLGGANGALLGRALEVNIDILYRAKTRALLQAEDIAAGIETAIASSSSIGNLARSWFLQAVEVSRDSDGSLPSVQLRLQWLVNYSTNERDPTVAIP